MGAAEDQLTEDERDVLIRALVKIVGPHKLARLAVPGRAVVPVRPEPRPEDFEAMRKLRRKKGLR